MGFVSLAAGWVCTSVHFSEETDFLSVLKELNGQEMLKCLHQRGISFRFSLIGVSDLYSEQAVTWNWSFPCNLKIIQLKMKLFFRKWPDQTMRLHLHSGKIHCHHIILAPRRTLTYSHFPKSKPLKWSVESCSVLKACWEIALFDCIFFF